MCWPLACHTLFAFFLNVFAYEGVAFHGFELMEGYNRRQMLVVFTLCPSLTLDFLMVKLGLIHCANATVPVTGDGGNADERCIDETFRFQLLDL